MRNIELGVVVRKKSEEKRKSQNKSFAQPGQIFFQFRISAKESPPALFARSMSIEVFSTREVMFRSSPSSHHSLKVRMNILYGFLLSRKLHIAEIVLDLKYSDLDTGR
jgi:hypothetical protein